MTLLRTFAPIAVLSLALAGCSGDSKKDDSTKTGAPAGSVASCACDSKMEHGCGCGHCTSADPKASTAPACKCADKKPAAAPAPAAK